jgi:hypothetical protein
MPLPNQDTPPRGDEDSTPPRSIPLLPAQPFPTHTRPAHLRVAGRVVTSIARTWREGESGPGGTCRLCDRCTARDGLCVITYVGYVAPASCPLFSTVGMHRQRPVGAVGLGVGGGELARPALQVKRR